MKDLIFILIERVGLLLIIAFVLTRIPGFKALLYREVNRKMTIIYISIFGIFGIVSSTLVMIIHDNEIITNLLIRSVENNGIVISLSLVAMLVAGLLGGRVVGLGAGSIVGIHLLFRGGVGWFANVLINPLTG